MKKTIIVLLFLITTVITAQDYVSPEDLADPNGQFAEVNDASIYYITHGDTENPVVILIHGFGGSTFTWRDNTEAIADAGYYVIALDLPPFGLSDKNPDIGYTRSDYADYVAGLMDILSIETATIVGHSMGGSVTAYFAVNYPERVDNLIFVAGGIFERAQEDTATNDNEQSSSPLGFLSTIDTESEQAAELLRLTLRPVTFGQIISSAYYAPDQFLTSEVVDGYARPLQIEDWMYGFLGYLNAEETNPISNDELAQAVDAPTLILWGEEDTWVSLSMGESMSETLTGTTFITYPLVGHLPMEENTQQFNEDIINFLANE